MDMYLVRHGQTQANADGIIQGWLDTELNETGLAQAEQAAASFDHPIDAIFSSDLKRCQQTAAFFTAKYPDIPFITDERLRERNFGDAQGRHRDEQDWEVFWASDTTISIPNAEVLTDFSARVQSFLDDVQQLPYRSVLVVTHGGTINRIATLTGKQTGHQAYGNSSITHIALQSTPVAST